MRIAVDAMGGDYAPGEIVKGAVEAARGLKSLTRLILVGDEPRVRAELAALGPIPELLEVRHASEVVGMDEAPAQAIRRKKDSSIGRCVDLVKDGQADAAVSAGNTGAVVVAATLKLRLLKGILRPAIATVMPTSARPIILLDAGASLDCDPEMLAQFGVMGSVYSKAILKQEDPVVGLLSIGGEDVKGNDVTKKAFGLLGRAPLRFRGNVEGHDLFRGETDVVVCDGFVGNVVLKTSESAAHAIGHWMKQEFKRNPMRMLGAVLLRGALRTMKQRMDPELYGGAPLLGVNGVCIITHGASSHRAIFHAVRVACEFVKEQINESIVRDIAGMGATE
ncbi:MAG: phosphate acyltransferase PlsX [Lentisphaerae bacterium RIFOXYC12_FULL_60_16]|nr:MAG: phosphate acyltransferase PlsX [Lentisphaerae bacterium RIFOXYC12_FULL_60_16]OGV73363.1 MAG: phosphate acyltransferase PlsX [Lentisphaerae bacterium RIFOXYA12_FULL_60_10]OGV83475.1 MAG: phosphate acyltransferase PlsX [Lentisphaerae bacterium RIFOXYB12_FULL_60_10]